MSCVWRLTIGDFEFEQGANYMPYLALAPFQRDDLEHVDLPVVDSPNEIETRYVYRAPARTVARRLDILGYTLPAARASYAKGIAALADYERESWPSRLLAPDGFDRWMAGDLGYPSGAQCMACGSVSRVYENSTCPRCGHRGRAEALGHDFHGFPFGHFLLVLRCLLLRHPADAPVSLDLTELVEGHYALVEPEPERFASRVPVIIVTEGKSDARILQKVINVLFPQYRDLTSFINHETAKARGGTSRLVEFVKMLISCGLKNRIVVLFDNDAAGHDAIGRLGDRVPDNVFALCLPSMDRFRAYPTLGPDGSTTSDVDGRACSLELYLGRDALTDPLTGGLRPVRWGGFVEGVGYCQGEVAGKGQVQARFEEILDVIQEDSSRRAQFDLAGIEAIFELMVRALASR